MVHKSFKRLGLSAVAIMTSLSLSATPALAAWSQNEAGVWSFLNEAGEKVTGWVLDGGKWYHLDPQGMMSTGWLQYGNSWYFLNADGDMATGWVEDGENWYYLNESGDMATGWVDDGENWYYLNESGDMATGWVEDGENWYYLNESGDMATGWVDDGENWYYLNESGDMATGWVDDGGTWYYLNESGDMATGWVDDGEKTYFMSSDGAMQSGVIEVDGEVFYFDESGAQQTGEVTIDGTTYNFGGENGSVSGDTKPAVNNTFDTSKDTSSSTGSSSSSNTGSGSGSSSNSGSGNDYYEDTYTPDPPHTHSYAVTSTPATCLKAGIDTYTCSCGHSYTADIAPLEHNLDENGMCSLCTYVVVSSSDALATAINAGGNRFNFYLEAGEYTLPTQAMQNKTFTFAGEANAIVNLTNAPLSHTQAASNATIKFDGVTIEFNDTKNYQGLAHVAKVSFDNCIINGKITLYSDADFTDCTFNNLADYNVWTWGTKNVTFTDCIFNSGGKALLVYADTATANFTVDVQLNRCIFNDNDALTTVKAAVEVGSNPKSTSTVYTITMTDCEVNGFAENNEGIPTGSTFWGNKNSMDANHLIVNIDGTIVSGTTNTSPAVNLEDEVTGDDETTTGDDITTGDDETEN